MRAGGSFPRVRLRWRVREATRKSSWCYRGRVRPLCLLAAIAVALASGCSRERAPQVAQAPRVALEPRAVTFAAADGGGVSADLYGDGAHAVVLAHGARFDKASWTREARYLAEHGLRVLAIDFRGYGASRAPAPSDDRDAGLEQDLLGAVDWLRAQGATRVSLVGGSMGGTACADALVQDGGRAIDDCVLLAHWPSAEPSRLAGRKLFVVAREDVYGEGQPRLPAIRAQFDAAPEPKRWLELDGGEHAQFLFAGEQGDALRAALLEFLREGDPPR